jgi:hypothetical protein
VPSFDVEFEVFCGKCGAGLCNNSETASSGRYGLKVTVDPCEGCLDNARQDGKDEAEKEMEEQENG